MKYPFLSAILFICAIFYYAGHGVPNETTKNAYLLPVDADGRQTEVCYPVNRLYKELGEYIQTNVRQQSVVVNRKSQTPTIVPSQAVGESWKSLKLR